MKRRYLTALASGLALSVLFGSAALTASAAQDSAQQASDVNISDAQATAETRALFANLRDTPTEHIRFGQQHATDEAISADATQGDVFDMTGKYPAVFGFDAGLALRGDEKPGSGSDQSANATALANAIQDADSKGAIVTLSAHWYNPTTGGSFNDTTETVANILPGGSHSATFNAMLDGIAQTALQAKRSDGTLIPIIFRPLHENNGSWFWWGATHATAAEYKELYRYIVNYLRDIKGVHNLLYAYSPGGKFNGDSTDYLATYPGDQWVDILGYDDYADDIPSWINAVVTDMTMVGNEAESRGKIAAFTEFGRKNIPQSGNDYGNYDFYDALRKALIQSVPNIAYMMTWANFGGSGSSFQSYTPWKGSDGENEFVAFANSDDSLMASPENVDYSATTSAASRTGSVRIVTPVTGSRITSTTLQIRVKVDDIQISSINIDAASVSIVHEGTTIASVPMTYSCNGYFNGTINLADYGIALDQTSLTLTPQFATLDGTAISPLIGESGSITVKLGDKPQDDANVIDTFDTYDSDEDLRNTYSPNNTTRANISLTNAPGKGEGQALQLNYDFSSYPGYNGFARAFSPQRDWSAYSAMSMVLQADGSNHKFVVQINAGGVTFEAYPSLQNTDSQELTLNFGDADGNGSDFSPASWDTANAGRKLNQQLLSNVGSFALYVNDNGAELPRSGALIIDSVSLTGERDPYSAEGTPTPTPSEDAEPINIDDFTSYTDTEELRSAWSNRSHTDVLSLAEGPAENEKSMRFSYDFSGGGWLDVARYLANDETLSNWSDQRTLSLDVQGDGSGNALSLQLGTSTGTYFQHDIKLDFTGWRHFDIALLDNAELTQTWPDNSNKGTPMTASDLVSMKEIVFASNQWNPETDDITFAVSNLKVSPNSGNAEDDSVAQGTLNQANANTDTGNASDVSITTEHEGKIAVAHEESDETQSADVTNLPASSCPIANTEISGDNGGQPQTTAKGKKQSTELAKTGSSIAGIAALALICAAVSVITVSARRLHMSDE